MKNAESLKAKIREIALKKHLTQWKYYKCIFLKDF